jgi:hypothetical protein
LWILLRRTFFCTERQRQIRHYYTCCRCNKWRPRQRLSRGGLWVEVVNLISSDEQSELVGYIGDFFGILRSWTIPSTIPKIVTSA